MDNSSITSGSHEADEDILTYTVSDEAIEAALATSTRSRKISSPTRLQTRHWKRSGHGEGSGEPR